MSITIQLIVYILLIIGVLYFMWKLKGDTKRFYGWAPPLAITAVWTGLIAALGSVAIWISPIDFNTWLITSLLFLDPFCMTTATLVLWIYRNTPRENLEDTIFQQLTQAKIAIFLGSIAIALGYAFVLLHPPGSTG